MKAIEIKGVSYRYPEREEYAVQNLDFTADEGEFVLVTGPSGCGKSTLCRLVNGLAPDYYGGELTGSITVCGEDTKDRTVAELASKVGLIFQDPENQIIMSNVESEIAFGPENMMMRQEAIGERIAWAAGCLKIGHLLKRRTDELSGGEKQKVVLASVLANKPKILVLDEPTSQLDPPSRKALFETLHSLNREGITVVLVEHNVKEVMPYVGRVFRMKPAKQPEKTRTDSPEPGDIILEVKKLTGGYGEKKVIDNLSLAVRQGECLAVTGLNGCGKTTLVKHFNGLLKPTGGSVTVCGQDTRQTPTEELARKVAYLPQNPSDMLFCDTAEDELRFTLKHLGIAGDTEAMLARFGLLPHKGSYPRDLSVGEKQRLALAAVLIAEPSLIVLDEPTRGADAEAKDALTHIIRGMLKDGKAVVIVTQERELVDELATKELRLGGKT